MAGSEIATAVEQTEASWRALRLFSGYRLFLASILFFVVYLQLPPDFLGNKYPALYQIISLSYLLLAVVLLVFSSRQWGVFSTQCSIQLLIDVLALALIIHTSGGLQTGLGALLVVIVVAGGALIPGRMAAFIAAIATLSVLLEASYGHFSGQSVSHFGQAGMLGAIFFITALLAQLVSRTMLHSQTLAEQRAAELSKLATLNQHIISRMQVAVLAVDDVGRVSLLNQSAQRLLGLDKLPAGFSLKNYVPELAMQLQNWQQHNHDAFKPFQARADLPELQARATRLDSGEILLFIENTTELAQQAQQLKLASLGRLTASIAHEIRNPLAAISHAGELLAEQRTEDRAIGKLTGIIERHSNRMNAIIETILQMSRRKTVEPQVVVLAGWLETFIEEFIETKQLTADKIGLTVTAPLARIWTDAQQLHQVLWNLLENALQHADMSATKPLQIKVAVQADEVIIDVADNGPGVSDEALKHLFEPFYSARPGGTGLGLYLARELCQANGARLSYLAEPHCFRMSYPLQRREMIQ